MKASSVSQNMAIRPLDVLVLGKLVVTGRIEIVHQMDLASSLKISQASVSLAFVRLLESGLIVSSHKFNPKAVEEFFFYGLKYVMPPIIGGITRGLATAHRSPFLKSKIQADDVNGYVWPDPDGKERGQALLPIHPSMVWAARKDHKLYAFFALFDAIRVGRAREIELAKKELRGLIFS